MITCLWTSTHNTFRAEFIVDSTLPINLFSNKLVNNYLRSQHLIAPVSAETTTMSLAGGREPRKTAGNRMSKLLDAEEEDEFYKTTYGGFNDVSNPRVPVHS